MGHIGVLGSINIDFVCQVTNLPKKGETIEAEDFIISADGKGANQAVAASKLGGKVVMAGKLGEDTYGDYLLKELRSNDIDTKYILKGGETGRTFINVNRNGDNTVTYYPGANKNIQKYEIKEFCELLNTFDFLVLQQELSNEILEYIIKTASKTSCEIILNAAPASFLNEKILGVIDTLIVNKTELEVITDEYVTSKKEIEIASKVLIDKGVKNIIVTLGEKGSILINEDEIIRVESIKVKAEDTTAAGDAYIGAYIVAKSENKTNKEAMEFATKISAMVVKKKGAQRSIPNREEVAQEYPE